MASNTNSNQKASSAQPTISRGGSTNNGTASEELVLSKGNFFANGSDGVDQITRYSGRGGQSTAVGAHLWGFNHAGMGVPLPKNKEAQGYVFFTRPRLRLSYDNVRAERDFKLLDSKDKYSVHRWVRATLDPVNIKNRPDCPLVDETQAFIPILSNSLKNLSGWPDVGVDTYTSSQGARNERWTMADGFARYYDVFNINCEFENTVNSPITELFYYWTMYMLLVHEGKLIPHLDSIFENELDYNTRIYRLIMDPSKTFIIDIAATGVAFPTNSAIAARYDYNDETPFNKNNDTVQIPFQCTGAIYKDPILMVEFNLTVQTFNPMMHDQFRAKYLTLLTPNEAMLFNHFGYPRINIDTGRLEWWVKNSEYKAILHAQGYK